MGETWRACHARTPQEPAWCYQIPVALRVRECIAWSAGAGAADAGAPRWRQRCCFGLSHLKHHLKKLKNSGKVKMLDRCRLIQKLAATFWDTFGKLLGLRSNYRSCLWCVYSTSTVLQSHFSWSQTEELGGVGGERKKSHKLYFECDKSKMELWVFSVQFLYNKCSRFSSSMQSEGVKSRIVSSVPYRWWWDRVESIGSDR